MLILVVLAVLGVNLWLVEAIVNFSFQLGSSRLRFILFGYLFMVSNIISANLNALDI